MIGLGLDKNDGQAVGIDSICALMILSVSIIVMTIQMSRESQLSG